MQLKGIIILLSIGVIGCIAILLVKSMDVQQSRNIVQSALHSTQPTTIPTPTSFPFSELTISYLRQRSYQSTLFPLREYFKESTYTSYLTSYISDGLRINALLTKPTSPIPANGFPAIIFIHGYIPPTQYKTTASYNAYVDYLARNGFVVFKIDLRGHDTSEGEASGAYYSSDYISDVLHAYSALQSTDYVNPNSIGLWGHSMAGNVVMRSLAAKPNIPAAVIWAGAVYTYTDLVEYGIDDNSYRPPTNNTERQRKRAELNNLYGQPTKESTFWQQVAPTNYLKDIKGAIQIHHAINDDVVSIDYNRNLTTLLTQTSIPHQLHEYPSGGHNIQGTAFTQAMQRSVEFYKKYLQ